MRFSRFRFILSLLSVPLVLLAFVLFVSTLTKLIDNNRDDKKSVSSFEIKRVAPKKKTTVVKKKKPKKQRKVAAPKLSTRLSGNSFGIAGLEGFGDMGIDDLIGDLRDVVMTSDTVDVPPKAKHRPPMSFPEEARRRGLQGFVKVGLLINSLGKVDQAKVLQSEPAGVFETIALNSVQKWIFEAAEYRGQKVRVWATTTIRFDMN